VRERYANRRLVCVVYDTALMLLYVSQLVVPSSFTFMFGDGLCPARRRYKENKLLHINPTPFSYSHASHPLNISSALFNGNSPPSSTFPGTNNCTTANPSSAHFCSGGGSRCFSLFSIDAYAFRINISPGPFPRRESGACSVVCVEICWGSG
jgi:hypothetical protein